MKNKVDYSKLFLKAQKYLSDGILIFDAMQKNIALVYINKSVKKIFGCTSKELIGKSYKSLGFRNGGEEHLIKMQNSFTNHIKSTIDLTIIRKDKTKVFCRISITPVPDKTKKTDYFICVLRDITEAREKLLNKVKLTVVESTLNSVNDIVFNFFNNLQYYRSEFEKHCNLEKVDLCEFDKTYNSTLLKLKKLNELKVYKERKIAEKLSVLIYP